MAHPVFGDDSFIVWCHCMGRFGNQMEGFLGGLRLAKELNRTLIVPPFVEYHGHGRTYPPFSKYFDVTRLGEFHRYITMEDFFEKFGDDKSWNRTAFCTRTSVDEKSGQCPMRRGQPSTDFWDKFAVEFDESITFDWLGTEEFRQLVFPSWRYPVIMLASAPGRFPMLERDRELQRYVVFRQDFLDEVDSALEELPRPILSVHLRNGIDWKNACKQATGKKVFMASPQCESQTNRNESNGTTITEEMCYASKEYTISQIKELVSKTGSRTVYIGTDHNSWAHELREELDRDGVRIFESPFSGQSAYIRDMAVYSTTDHFLGNCISSFTSFAVRYRTADNLESYFFGKEMKVVTVPATRSSQPFQPSPLFLLCLCVTICCFVAACRGRANIRRAFGRKERTV